MSANFHMKGKITLTILILSTLCLQSLLLNNVVRAQSSSQSSNSTSSDQPAQIQDVEGLRAEFKQSVQDPDTQIIQFQMILHSTIDSDRAKISWSLNGPSEFTSDSNTNFETKIQNGQSYTITVNVKVDGFGVTELFGQVSVFQADKNFLVTVRKDFVSNNIGEVNYMQSEYDKAKNISAVKKILLVLGILLVIIFLGFLAFKKFVKWFNRDEKAIEGTLEPKENNTSQTTLSETTNESVSKK